MKDVLAVHDCFSHRVKTTFLNNDPKLKVHRGDVSQTIPDNNTPIDIKENQLAIRTIDTLFLNIDGSYDVITNNLLAIIISVLCPLNLLTIDTQPNLTYLSYYYIKLAFG